MKSERRLIFWGMQAVRFCRGALICFGMAWVVCSSAWAGPIGDWNGVMMAAVRMDTTGPTLSSRNLALLHLAMYDAVNSIVATHQPYAISVPAAEGASAEAAAVGAGYVILKALYPGVNARTEALWSEWRAGVPETAAIAAGLEAGREVARRMLELRSGDGAATDVPYIPRAEPGQWRRTPPFFRPPLTPGWRYVEPFALRNLEPFVPPAPPGLDSPAYARDWDEVRRLGGRTSTERTPEQALIAEFWSDFSYTSMPPGHWYEIALDIAVAAGLGLEDQARLLALLSLAQADAAIVCWEAKFRYNLWRPVTAIQRADEDGNPSTDRDESWDHYLQAPPFPAYPSGHSTFSKAGSEVLAAFLGTDAISFSARSDAVPGVERHFVSLAACADEIGMSRIYGGIHFGFDNREGKRSGSLVAGEVLAHWLLPLTSLPRLQLEGVSAETVRLRVHGRVGHRVQVERSDDLSRWDTLTAVDGKPGGVGVVLPAGERSQGFFRVLDAAGGGAGL